MSHVGINESPLEHDPVMFTSEDTRDRKMATAEKLELVEAMLNDGSHLLVIKGRVDTFGYYNPLTKVRIIPAEFSEQHITKIMNELRRDYPHQTVSSIKWEMKFLFLDMPEVVKVLDEHVFDPSSNDLFPVKGDSEGRTVTKYNQFDPERRPISNTIVKPSADDELVAKAMAKALDASINSIVRHSAPSEESKPRLYSEIKSVLGGFCQPVHKRLKVAPILYGEQGSGKSLVAVTLANLGGYAETISVDKLTGNFGARWDTACTVISDEGEVYTEAQANMAKRFMTGTTIDLEEKYKNAVGATIQFNWIITTNNLADFRTFSYENRRYWVLHADGEPMAGGDITPAFTVTGDEYDALARLREFAHIKGANSSTKALKPTAYNVADKNGNHRLKVSQMGDIIEKPTQYLGVFIALARIVSKWHDGSMSLDTIQGRTFTIGDKMLSDTLPQQKGVEFVNDKVTAQLELLETGGNVKDAIANEHYINVTKLFYGGKPLGKNDLPYLKSDFYYNGEGYTTVIGGEYGDTLLIKCKKGDILRPKGKALKKAAFEKIAQIQSSVDDAGKVSKVPVVDADSSISVADAVTRYLDQRVFDYDGTGEISVSIADMALATGVNKRKLGRIKKHLPDHVKFTGDTFAIVA